MGKLVYVQYLLIIDMQIIHRFSGFYPFGLQHQGQNTFVQVLKQDLCQSEISHYRMKYKFFKEMVLTTLIRLLKLSREKRNLRFLYEYEPLSLQKFLQQLGNNTAGRIEPAAYRCLLRHFKINLDAVANELIHYQIKTDLLLTNLAVNTHSFPFQLKLFVEPDCECFALKMVGEARHQELKQLVHQNKLDLIEFYSSEKKKLIIEFEELMELYFGKIQEEENRPNFIINGVKLVFINQDINQRQATNDSRDRKKSTSTDKMSFSMKNEHQRQRRRGSGQENTIRDLAELSCKKFNSIKPEITKKNHIVSTNSIDDKPQTSKTKKHSDNIHFQPAEITKDHTLIVQEQDYLQSLEDEIKNMAVEHQQTEEAKQIKRNSPALNASQGLLSVGENKPENGKIVESRDTKVEKKHKYKMKIITSHDVEIEEEKDPETIDINEQNFSEQTQQKLFLDDMLSKQLQQFRESNRGQNSEKRILQARHSDGDTHILKAEGENKGIATSLIAHDQSQQSSCKCCPHSAQPCEQQASEKQGHAETYLHKIQSAKQKAQKLLRQYAQHKVRKA